MTLVRPGTRADIAKVSAMLARAFDDDPLMRWLFGDNDRVRPARIQRFLASEAKRHLAHDGFLTSSDHTGAALFAPPGHWRAPWHQMLRSAPTMTRIMNWRMPRAMRLLNLLEGAHPAEPHCYVHVVGTDPQSQRRGMAATLMGHIVDRCDREGIAIYGEVTKKENVPYYHRFGIRLIDELTIPGGPTLWPMWRDPGG